MTSPRRAEDSDRCHTAKDFQKCHPPQAVSERSEPFPASGWAVPAEAQCQGGHLHPELTPEGPAQAIKAMRLQDFSFVSPYWNNPFSYSHPCVRAARTGQTVPLTPCRWSGLWAYF